MKAILFTAAALALGGCTALQGIIGSTGNAKLIAVAQKIEAGAQLAAALAKLGIARGDIVQARWADNGPGWIGVMLESAEAVLALRPPAIQACTSGGEASAGGGPAGPPPEETGSTLSRTTSSGRLSSRRPL